MSQVTSSRNVITTEQTYAGAIFIDFWLVLPFREKNNSYIYGLVNKLINFTHLKLNSFQISTSVYLS